MAPPDKRLSRAEEAALAWLEAPAAEPAGAIPSLPASDVVLKVAAANSQGEPNPDSALAREVVNSGDAVVDLAALHAAEPPVGLRERIVQSLGRTPARTLPSAGVRAASPSGGAAPVAARWAGPANEALGLLHIDGPDEARRTAAIDGLRALGGPGEEAVDGELLRLIDRMAPLLTMEIVFVSVVRGAKTIHRVHRGFPPELGNLDVVPRELSFCTHTVSAAEPFFVDDTEREAFFRQSDLVRKLGARAYVGVPIRIDAPGGPIVLGSLCGISRAPQKIGAADVELVRAFARVAEAVVNKHPEQALVAPDAQPQVCLREPHFSDVVRAVRAQSAAGSVMGCRTWLVQAPREQFHSLVFEALLQGDSSFTIGELPGGELGALVPSRHPRGDEVHARLSASRARSTELV